MALGSARSSVPTRGPHLCCGPLVVFKAHLPRALTPSRSGPFDSGVEPRAGKGEGLGQRGQEGRTGGAIQGAVVQGKAEGDGFLPGQPRDPRHRPVYDAPDAEYGDLGWVRTALGLHVL